MFMDVVEKAGINGIITGAASAAVFGLQPVVVPQFMSNTIPLYLYMFLGGVASSLVTDSFHVFMKKEIPLSKKANDRASVVSGLAINAIAFYGLLRGVNQNISNDLGMFTTLAIGAASEFASASSYTYLKEKMYI